MADRCGLAAAFDFDDIFVVGGNLGLVDVAVLNLERCRLLVVCGLEIRAGTGANQLAAQSRGMSCLLPALARAESRDYPLRRWGRNANLPTSLAINKGEI